MVTGPGPHQLGGSGPWRLPLLLGSLCSCKEALWFPNRQYRGVKNTADWVLGAWASVSLPICKRQGRQGPVTALSGLNRPPLQPQAPQGHLKTCREKLVFATVTKTLKAQKGMFYRLL